MYILRTLILYCIVDTPVKGGKKKKKRDRPG